MPRKENSPTNIRQDDHTRDFANADARRIVNPDRILRLAYHFSVVGMSQLPGMPDAGAIYKAIEVDPQFQRDFVKASAAHKRMLRTEHDDLRLRSERPHLSRLSILLRRLRKNNSALNQDPSNGYDLTRLSDDELGLLEKILVKAQPDPAALKAHLGGQS